MTAAAALFVAKYSWRDFDSNGFRVNGFALCGSIGRRTLRYRDHNQKYAEADIAPQGPE